MAKHTPGPWRIRTSAESSTQEIIDTRGLTVCEVGDCSMEDDANARLLVASPDMLAALQLVRMSAGWQVLSSESRAVIDAAIARATACPQQD